ncbi:MAG: hypothetical protein PVJ21_08210 [Anaerolineales bacterium]
MSRKYPPSRAGACEVCLGYCMRPGWWSVAEAARAMEAGYSPRMMLEVAPEFTFGVLSPAFKGCEGDLASNLFSRNGCTFLRETQCELYGTGHQPLECRFCHHERLGLGPLCHADLERDWNTRRGQMLVREWIELTGWEEFQLMKHGTFSSENDLSEISLST